MNTELEKAIHIATQIAEEHQHESFGPAHLIKASLNRDLSLLRFLHDQGVDVYFMEEWADVNIEAHPKRTSRTMTVRASSQAKIVFVEAEEIQNKLNKEETDLVCLFISAITPGVGFSLDQLKSLPVSGAELLSNLSQGISPKNTSTGSTTAQNNFSAEGDVLKKYTKDLLVDAAQGYYAHIINRDRELKQIAEILSRKSKPNVMVQGESGVQQANLLEIDTSVLLSGASYKGEVEDRLQNIFNASKNLVKPILFIDDFHSLLQDAGTSQGILNVIKSELNKGEVILIGATTADSYRKHIANDDGLNRRFESVSVEEPDSEMAFRILKSVGQTYTDHHNLQVNDEALRESIRLSKRYLKEKSLPDSALDLVDRTMAAANVSTQSLPGDLEDLNHKIEELEKLSGEQAEADNIQAIDWIYIELKNRLSPIVLGKYDTEDGLRLPGYQEKISYVKSILTSISKHIEDTRTNISEEDLAAMVSGITGIPAGKVQTQERERGQDNAINTVSEAIIESRSGLSKAGQPIGSFFFSGPTGTGKTELAKSLAEFLFNDETAIIRFDMSEFKEEHSAALLYGAPPGYVGYEEGGVLVNKIRQKPYAIVLFDEIEKAHQSVFDVFLQILDEGKLNDRLGKVGDFSNAVILFTSNIGSEFISKSIEGGKVPKSDELLEIMASYFRPEFLGRITEIVPFAPISEKNAPAIFDLHLKKELLVLTERLGITLEIDKKTKEHLSLDGFSPTYGVRPLKAVIRNKLKRPLSKMIISGALKAPQRVKVTLKKDELDFKVMK